MFSGGISLLNGIEQAQKDKLEQYRQIIRQFLTDQAHLYAYSDDVEAEIICDTEHNHYQIAYVGWLCGLGRPATHC
ncbi:MAG TPA: element excision factor XisI family protein [Leptolyngbya sp.]|jgi:hypothetical protein|nr:element excision factor XisI family protein [Leptolyngbya sp.]